MSTLSDFVKVGTLDTHFGLPAMPKGVGVSTVGTSNEGTSYPLFSIGVHGTSIHLAFDANLLSSEAKYYKDNVLIWAIDLDDINSALTLSLTEWSTCHWYDSVDLAYYVICKNGSLDYYLIKITNAGSISLIGNDTSTNYGFTLSYGENLFMTRASMGSGDFTVYRGDTWLKVIISSSNGAASSAGDLSLTNSTIKPALQGAQKSITYLTANGDIAVSSIVSQTLLTHSLQKTMLGFLRGDKTVMIDIAHLPIFGVSTTAVAGHRFSFWDGKVVFKRVLYGSSQSSRNIGFVAWERVDFDAWLVKMCDHFDL